MDKNYGTGWDATTAINAYFEAAGLKDSNNDDITFTKNNLQDIYTIDYDVPSDFFFGMEMEMNFLQPKGGKTGLRNASPMDFLFTGDDDVWVYVDGVLFLDLSGIHRHVGGRIDFTEGKVYYYELNPATGDINLSAPYATKTFTQILNDAGKSDMAAQLNSKGTFADYTEHNFKFYYMERGAGSSVCHIKFNFPLLQKNSIYVTKELSADDDTANLLGNPDFKFQIMKADGSGLFILPNTTYDILDSTNTKVGSGKVDSDGIFTIKAGETAVFTNIAEDRGSYFVRELFDSTTLPQYGQVSIDGTVTAQNSAGVTVASQAFTTADSPVKDISEGSSTKFTYNNMVSTAHTGSLSVSKKLEEYPQSRVAQMFDIEITLDGEKLPVGTKYTVGSKERTVATAGIIQLHPSEEATVNGILAGSKFTVRETELSADGYSVKYQVDSAAETTDSAGATGIIGSNTTVKVLVTNAEEGCGVNIPLTKQLRGSDTTEHTYSFTLTEVTDEGATAAMPGGHTDTATVTLIEGSKDTAFTIGYATVDFAEASTLPQTFYYKISETANPDDTATSYDDTVYVVCVTVDENDNGKLVANISKYLKDGSEFTPADGENITFTNAIATTSLPETGGPGVVPILLAAAAMFGGAGFIGKKH